MNRSTTSLFAIFACRHQGALQQLCPRMKQTAAALTSSFIQHLTRRRQGTASGLNLGNSALLQSNRKQNFTAQAVVEHAEPATYYEAREQYIVAVNSAQQRRQLDVKWQHGEVTSYPFVWLRDNCHCPVCYNQTAKSRCQLVSDLLLDAYPIHTKVDSQQVHITWSDEHVSIFDAHWLYQHSFTKGARKQRSLWLERPAKLWGSTMGKHLKVMDFAEVMQDNRRLYDWIVALEEDGIVLLRNVSQQPRPLHSLAKRVGVLRWTHYGSTCIVVSKPNPSNVAFTEGALNSHTDLAFYNYVPGVQMMSCIKQTMSEGGANQYVDGFQVASQLRQQRPDLFRILCDTELTFYDVGSELYKFHTISRHRTIGLNSQGEIESVVFSNHSRDSYCNLPLEDVPTFYEALKKLDDLFRDPSNKFEYKMRDNEMMTFNNYRVLHARSPYTMDTVGERTLETGYIDWDEMRSRRRVLMEELGIADLCV